VKNKYNKHRFNEITKILLKNKLQKGLTPERVRKALDELGPTFVKLGQIASTREDLIPKEYAEELKKLKENVSPMPFELVEEIINEELKAPWQTYFKEINASPIGSASIGQVHVATLIDNTKVVLKVMRPNILNIVEQDFQILKKAVKYLNLFTSIDDVVDLNVIFDETKEAMRLEMDFENELENLNLFSELFKDINYIKFPRTFPKYSTSHLLVMEYISGIKIDDITQLKQKGYDLKEICSKLIENFTSQIIDKGIFHADPHSGNVLIEDGKIVWLDLGMVGKISKKDQALYKRAIKAIINNDIYEIKRVILSIGVIKEPINHAMLYQDIESLMMKYLDMDIAQMNMGVIFEEVIEIAKKHNIALPKGVTLLGRSIIIIQKTVALLDEKANLLSFFASHIKNNYEEDFSLKKKLPTILKQIYTSTSKTTKIPQALYDVLDLTIKGEKTENIEIVNLKENTKLLSNSINNLTIAIIVASLVLGVSLILGIIIFVSKLKWLMIVLGIGAVVLIFIIIFVLIMLFKKILKEKKK